MRSRELGHQRYKEALPSVERTLHTQGCTGSTRGTRGALGCGATLSARVRGPAPGGSSETVPGAGSCASTPTPGLLSGARAAGRTAAKRVLGLLPAGRGRLPVSRRPRELTFTKLSASGKPGSTISSSDLAALVADGALDSRGLGGAIFSACTALLARVPESTRRARTTHVQRPS